MTQFVEIPASKNSLANRTPICGTGINDADYMVCPRINGKMLTCPFYQSWVSMIKRCYCPKLQARYPTYKDCSVTKHWLTFSNFKSWMTNQDWKDKQLDKDILVVGNKTYSPENCLFVSGQINNLLIDSSASRGKYPQGVSFHKRLRKYRSYCMVNGKQNHIGLFATPKEAELTYLKFKSLLIIKTANCQEALKTPRLRYALLRHAKIMTDRIKSITERDCDGE